MSKKTVSVEEHVRSKPNLKNPWDGKGNKPGPKSVEVKEHKRGK